VIPNCVVIVVLFGTITPSSIDEIIDPWKIGPVDIILSSSSCYFFPSVFVSFST
jgi:hypothetical protein